MNNLDIFYYIKEIKYSDINLLDKDIGNIKSFKFNPVFDKTINIDELLKDHNNSCDICNNIIGYDNKYMYCSKCKHIVCHECLVKMININSESILSCYCTIDNKISESSEICGYNYSVEQLFSICSEEEIYTIFNIIINNYENKINSDENMNKNSKIIEIFKYKYMTHNKIDFDKLQNYNNLYKLFEYFLCLNKTMELFNLIYFNQTGEILSSSDYLYNKIYEDNYEFISIQNFIGLCDNGKDINYSKNNNLLFNAFIPNDRTHKFPLVDIKLSGDKDTKDNLALFSTSYKMDINKYKTSIKNELIYYNTFSEIIDKIYFLKDHGSDYEYHIGLKEEVLDDIKKSLYIFDEVQNYVKNILSKKNIVKNETSKIELFKSIIEFSKRIKELFNFPKLVKAIPDILKNITKDEFRSEIYSILILGKLDQYDKDNNKDESYIYNFNKIIMSIYSNLLTNTENINIPKNNNIGICSCKGIIKAITDDNNKTTHKCISCNKIYCKDCNDIIEDNNHKCDENIRRNWSNILENTTTCSGCGARIGKISGCDVMFCTICYTSFNYVTGETLSNNLHNPHRIEWLKSINSDDVKNGNPGFQENVNGVCIDVTNYTFNNILDKSYRYKILKYQAHLNEFIERIRLINKNFIKELNLQVLFKNNNLIDKYNLNIIIEYYKFLELNSMFDTYIDSLTDILQVISQVNIMNNDLLINAINDFDKIHLFFSDEINNKIKSLNITNDIYNNIMKTSYIVN